MNLRKYFVLMLAVSLVAVAGCGNKDEDDLGGGSGQAVQAAVMGTGVVSGKVTLIGKAPVADTISMDADPVCKAQHSGVVKDETVVADAKGDLANVFVYVKDGAGNYPAPTEGVTLTQKGCMYIPHVFGVQVGQPFEIVNDDPTLHNVHCMAVTNDTFNVGQPSQGMKTEKKFTKPEVLIKFKCDVHSWMHCYGGVVSNPFYSVSAKDGSFKISGLPAGSYTLVAVHEKYGESQPQKVDLKDGESKSIDFSFTAQ